MSEEQSRRPKDGPFYQQQLKAWQPILTPRWVIGTFLSVGVVFIAIGIPLKLASDSVVEVMAQYDGEGADAAPQCRLSSYNGTQCTVSLRAPKLMERPVFVYYEIDNFYQNHRRYVKSRSDKQLAGTDLDAKDLEKDCDPLVTNSTGQVLNPCGLIANSFFNDTFRLNTSPFVMNETGIAWESDRKDKFKNPPSYKSDRQYLWQTYPSIISREQNVENEHFIVWMRTAALPRFRKLYGRIEQDVQEGATLNFTIDANFRVDTFKGRKWIVLSTTSWLGGKNPFLGYAYIIVGAICVLLSLLFAVKQILCPRKLGDASRLEWRQ